MARARNIKPGFFKNEYIADLSCDARLLFIGLWTISDREGRLEDRPKRIKAELFPFDSFDIDPMLNQLQSKGFLVRYEIDGLRLIYIHNFVKHQDPHYKEVASVLPPFPGTTDEVVAITVTKIQRARIFDRDGHICTTCGSENNLSIDHVLPVSMGGDSSDNNLQTLCFSCNSSKSNKIDGVRAASKKSRCDFTEAINFDPSLNQRQPDVEITSNQNQVKQVVTNPLIPDSLYSDSLIPSSLNPDSLLLIPSSPIPDSLKLIPSVTGVEKSAPPPKTGISESAKPETDLQVACRETWKLYGNAYFSRYGTEPVRNAKVNSQVKQFVQRLGAEESPHVAAHFVKSNLAYYTQRGHTFDCLLADAEKLRTEWATGQSMTATRARQLDQSQANASVVGDALKILEGTGHAQTA